MDNQREIDYVKMNPANPKYNIIIDTDCAVDDLRAITMLCALKEVNIKGIITSDGTLPPETGAKKVRALLQFLGRLDIPVGIGRKFNRNPPFWREFNSTIYWGDEQDVDQVTVRSAGTLLRQVLEKAQDKITLICLGPLTNIADLLRQSPQYFEKIRSIIWYIESVSTGFRGSNYETDRFSALRLLYSGLKFFCISSLGKSSITIDENYISSVSVLKTIYAGAVLNSFISPGMEEKLQTKHLKLWDDLVPLFVVAPYYFQMDSLPGNTNVFYTTDYDCKALKSLIFSILSGWHPGVEKTLTEYSEKLIKQTKRI